MKYTLCKKQYVEKAENIFNIRLNNHREDAKNPYPKTILLCKYFQEKNRNFDKQVKFTIIEKLKKKTQENLKTFCGNAYFKEKTFGSKH